MADNTHIQWTDRTFNVVSGCTKISDGCTKCYIERTPPFRMAGRKFDKPGVGGTTGVILHEDRLTQPLSWRMPSRVFVCSLADLFHEEVPDAFIAKLFAIMSRTPQHTYQLLTKRPARMRALLSSGLFWIMVNAERFKAGVPVLRGGGPICLPNVWVGVSAENQQWADIRIPLLLATPAAVRWVSAEPLIGPITLADHWTGADPYRHDEPSLTWMVVGGESGPGSRPTDIGWIRSLVAQCRAGSTAPFVKQLGSVWARDYFVGGDQVARTDPKGGDWGYWPDDVKIREYPTERTAVTA